GQPTCAEAGPVHEPRPPPRALFGGPVPDDRYRDDATVHRDRDGKGRPRRVELLEDERESESRSAQSAIRFWHAHAQHAQATELRDDVARNGGLLLGGGA